MATVNVYLTDGFATALLIASMAQMRIIVIELAGNLSFPCIHSKPANPRAYGKGCKR